MIPKFRAWSKTEKIMSDVKKIDFYNSEIDARLFEETAIEEVVLMQSTGILDKNSQEIFEGDVVRQVRTQPTTENEVIIGIVTMIEGAWLIMNDNEQLASYLWSETDENEIIGNIYENPELLEEKK